MADLGIDGITDATLVASGGSALIYRARDRDENDVAVKVLRGMRGTEVARRFQREQRANELLGDHPNIINVLGSGTTGSDEPYLVMPWIEGGSLQDQLENDGPFGVRQAIADVRGAAEAIDFAHDKGVLHRDIKPGNLLRAADGSILVTDFGIARVKDAGITSATIGATTPLYAAPELLAENEASIESEVYSLGALLYALLAGKPAFADSGNIWATMHRIRTEDPPRIPGVHPPVMRVIAAAMAKDPADRPGDAGLFSVFLREAVDADDDWAPPPPAPQTRQLDRDLPPATPSVPAVPSDAAPPLPPSGRPQPPQFDRPAPPVNRPPDTAGTGRSRLLPIAAGLLVLAGLGVFAISQLFGDSPTSTETVEAPVDNSIPPPVTSTPRPEPETDDGPAGSGADPAEPTPAPSATPASQLVSFNGEYFSALLPEGWSVVSQDRDVGYGYRSRFVAGDMYLNIDTTPVERQSGPVDIAQSARDVASGVSSASAVRSRTVDGLELHSFTFVNNRGVDSIDIFFEVDGDGYAIVAGSPTDPAGAFAIAELVATSIRSK